MLLSLEHISGMMTVMAVTANNYSGGDDDHKFGILNSVGIYFPVE